MANVGSKYDLTEAKKMFLDFRPLRVIAEECKINYRTLLYHSKKWERERDMLRNEILRELGDNKKTILIDLTGNALDLINRAVKDLKERQKPPTMHEARLLTNVISEIDKIIRLDDGSPTDIIAEQKPSTVIELKAKLKKDPFYIEDADFREIANEKTSGTTNDDAKSDSDGGETESN